MGMSDSFDKFLEQGEQKSPDWLMARVGLTTASRTKDVTDKLKNGQPGAKRKAYLWEKVIEKLTGQPAAHYESAAMQWGVENEPLARMAAEARLGVIISQVGLIHHPTIADFAGSPDGLIDDDGGFEAKCPFNSAHHLECFLTGMPEEHIPQVQSLMACTERAYWWFASHDPRLPAPLDLFLFKVARDEDYIVAMESEVTVFNAEVAAMVEKLKAIA
jgi:hypothetical protein